MGFLGGFNTWFYTHCNLIPLGGLGLNDVAEYLHSVL
jgi:hypothetical protein